MTLPAASPSLPLRATARAHANIALAKYWGKIDEHQNLPAVPSVSVTLEALTTYTQVRFEDGLEADEITLDGEHLTGRSLARVVALLDEVRATAGLARRARVTSTNSFPTGAGLASSASGFAALALASLSAAGLPIDQAAASDLARRASASAARSIFGGFVRLQAGVVGQRTLAAKQIAGPEHWDLRVVIAVTSEHPKRVSSTHGMQQTARTSPYYGAWVKMSGALVEQVQEAIARKDLAALGKAAEHSALSMHACAMAAQPPLIYLEPTTIACVHSIRALRQQGVDAWCTIDAGPQVKVLTTPEQAAQVHQCLLSTPGVLRTIESRVGCDAAVEVTQP